MAMDSIYPNFRFDDMYGIVECTWEDCDWFYCAQLLTLREVISQVSAHWHMEHA